VIIRKLQNAGVEIIADALAIRSKLPALLFEHGLLVLREQRLTPVELVAIAEEFGACTHNKALWQDHAAVLRVSNELGPDGQRTGILDSDVLEWHADGSHLYGDHDGVILFAQKSDNAATTTWADMSAAYRALDPSLRQCLNNTIGVHDFFSSDAGYPLPEDVAGVLRERGPRRRKLIHDHPVTERRSLYVSPMFLSRLEGVAGPIDLQWLAEFSTQGRFCYSHLWRDGDLILFDNLTTMHRRSALAGARTLLRVQFGYERWL
jgi:taurine dioxygenase